MLLLVALTGCGDGPNPETMIDELRIVAAVAEPPEVAEGEPYELTVVVADPEGEGGALGVWTCPAADACRFEALDLGASPLSVSLTALGPVPVWMLACAPGRCELPSEADEASLRDPLPWLQRLPLSGVSAASRTTRIAEGEPRLANPELIEVPTTEVSGGPDEEVELRLLAPGARTAYGLATTGGFTRPSFDVASDGRVTLTWIAGAAPATGMVYVVLESDGGGTAVWTAPAETR